MHVLTKKQVKNVGQLPQYYVTDNHEAIISKEMFKRVQFERTRRASLTPVVANTKTNAGRYTAKYALTGLMLCGECGHCYRRITWYRNKERIIVWRCTNRLENGSRNCRNSPTISEPILHDTIMRFITNLGSPKEIIKQSLVEHSMEAMESETGDEKRNIIQRKLEETNERLTKMLNADIISDEQIQALSKEYDSLQKELEGLGGLREQMETENAHVRGIREYIQSTDFNKMEFDERLVREVIEQIIVRSKDKLYIRLKGGYEAEVTMSSMDN